METFETLLTQLKLDTKTIVEKYIVRSRTHYSAALVDDFKKEIARAITEMVHKCVIGNLIDSATLTKETIKINQDAGAEFSDRLGT